MHQKPTSDATAARKLRIAGLCLLGHIVVVLTDVMMHFVLPPVSTTQTQRYQRSTRNTMKPTAATLQNSSEVPLGTIIAWIPSPNQDWVPALPIPKGWHICNGSAILDVMSPWIGQNSPNLTNRFLRGGDFSNFLDLQEDQIQDHEHIDRGHTHVDQGHTHVDYGHTHQDLGHTHTDTGHIHEDAGHTHSYTRTNTKIGGKGGFGTRQEVQNTDSDITTNTKADIQNASAVLTTDSANLNISYASISTNQANIMNATSNTHGVIPESQQGARIGGETRPKSMYIIYIIKVANYV